nr:proton/oligopeptide symporter [Salmonella sp. NCTC 7297]
MSTANNKPTESVSLNAFKQPKAFYLIFSIELWERFGYYGLQGIMAVYLVKTTGYVRSGFHHPFLFLQCAGVRSGRDWRLVR